MTKDSQKPEMPSQLDKMETATPQQASMSVIAMVMKKLLETIDK